MPLLHAHEIMVKKGLSSLPVTENGRLLGVVFPKTISPYLPDTSSQTTGVASLSQAAQHATLGDVIKDEPLSVGVQTTIQEAAQLMLSKDMACKQNISLLYLPLIPWHIVKIRLIF